MRQWLSRTQVGLHPMLAVYGALLIIIAVATAGAAIHWLTSASSDRIAVIGNFLSLGTLLLALVAGIVALVAYSAATGLPSLKLKINLPLARSRPNAIILRARMLEESESNDSNDADLRPLTAVAVRDAENVASIIVANGTRYAARTPAVIIKFHDCAIAKNEYALTSGWTATEQDPDTGEVFSLQWDGGPNYAIHGNSARHLPGLNLTGLWAFISTEGRVGDRPRVTIRLLADGYNRSEITLPVHLTPDPENYLVEKKEEWLLSREEPFCRI